jgi:hypothetical protein
MYSCDVTTAPHDSPNPSISEYTQDISGPYKNLDIQQVFFLFSWPFPRNAHLLITSYNFMSVLEFSRLFSASGSQTVLLGSQVIRYQFPRDP